MRRRKPRAKATLQANARNPHLPRMLIRVSPTLARPTGVTMRNLRRCRQLWAVRSGLLPPPSWSGVDLAQVVGLAVTRRLAGRQPCRSDSHVECLGGRAVIEELGEELRQAARSEHHVNRTLKVGGTPPPYFSDAFCLECCLAHHWSNVEGRDAHQVEAIGLAIPPRHRQPELVGARPNRWPERLGQLQAELFAQLTRQGRGVILSVLDPASRSCPERPVDDAVESHKDDTASIVDNQASHCWTKMHAAKLPGAR